MAQPQRNWVRVAIKQPDGGVAIMQFMTLIKRNPSDPGFTRAPNAENIAAEVAKAGYGSAPWRIIPEGEWPMDRKYRNAWVDNDNMIFADPVKTKEINDQIALDAAIEAERKKDYDALVARAKANMVK